MKLKHSTRLEKRGHFDSQIKVSCVRCRNFQMFQSSVLQALTLLPNISDHVDAIPYAMLVAGWTNDGCPRCVKSTQPKINDLPTHTISIMSNLDGEPIFNVKCLTCSKQWNFTSDMVKDHAERFDIKDEVRALRSLMSVRNWTTKECPKCRALGAA